MGRPHRRPSESGIHHVMNRGVDHQPIFFDDVDRLEMGRRLAEINEAFAVDTLAYCLMGNHLHLVLRAPPDDLPRAMHHLTSVYSHRFNARHRRDGPLFRGRYHSIPVDSDAYLVWVVRYVHRNALDISGVGSPRDYRWSSYRAYLGLRPTPSFLDRQPILDLVGGRIEELVAITEGVDPAPLHSIEDVTRLIRCGLAVDDLATTSGDRPTSKVERTLLLLLASRAVDPRLRRTIDTELGSRTARAARVAAHRAEGRRLEDARVSRTLDWIEQHLACAA